MTIGYPFPFYRDEAMSRQFEHPRETDYQPPFRPTVDEIDSLYRCVKDAAEAKGCDHVLAVEIAEEFLKRLP